MANPIWDTLRDCNCFNLVVRQCFNFVLRVLGVFGWFGCCALFFSWLVSFLLRALNPGPCNYACKANQVANATCLATTRSETCAEPHTFDSCTCLLSFLFVHSRCCAATHSARTFSQVEHKGQLKNRAKAIRVPPIRTGQCCPMPSRTRLM